MNFVFGAEQVTFNFEKAFQEEDARIQLGEGKYYFPDLFVRFKDNNAFFQKWNGKAAIEVTYKHPCEYEKLYDLKIHNIPIIEVVLNESICFKPELRKENFLPEDLERHFNFLVDTFSEKVYAKILVDPKSPDFQDQIESEKDEKIHILFEKLIKYQEANKTLEENLELKSNEINTHKTNLNEIKKKQNKIATELEKLKSRSFIDRVLNRDIS